MLMQAEMASHGQCTPTNGQGARRSLQEVGVYKMVNYRPRRVHTLHTCRKAILPGSRI